MTQPDVPAQQERLFEAARTGDVATLAALLDERPELLHARAEPYAWTLLHTAAHHGQLAVVELLLAGGLDPNLRERGDNTYAMHWAAAGGHLDIVRCLADAGGDIVGAGDDHQLEVIGWATCWPGCGDAAHRAVADFLLARGARHHIFSAIALNLGHEVRRIVAEDPASLGRPMSHNEDFQWPLHFAVRMSRPGMVALLLELGADPLATDGSGLTAAVYATTPSIDEQVMAVVRARGGPVDLLTAVALREWETAAPLLSAQAGPDAGAGALHLMANRDDVVGVQWLLEHGADANGLWAYAGAQVTALHLAAKQGHVESARLLLRAGADPRTPDSMHHADAVGWAEYFGHAELAELLRNAAAALQLHPEPPAP